MTRARRVGEFSLLAVMLSALTAGAQAADATLPAAAEALFRAGRDALNEGNIPVACERFRESLRLEPAVGTLFNLASCEERLGNVTQAWQYCRRLLDELPRRDSRRATVRRQLEVLDARVPRVTLLLAPHAPPSTQVRRGGVGLTTASFAVPLPLEVGKHELLVTAPGRAKRRYTLELREGARQTLMIEPGPEVSTRAEMAMRPPQERAPPDHPTSVQRTLGIGAVGFGVAAAIVSVSAGVLLVAANERKDALCAAKGCTEEGLKAVGRAELLQTTLWISGAVAAVSSGTGVLLLFLDAESAVAGSPPKPAGLAWRTTF
ncbi:MAG TPA: hypothetical protein VI072_21395 [Polyangiaceae bacterium]